MIDLSVPRRLHVVGVGGPGMSAIAIVLAEMGHTVSGSDIREQPVLDRLRAGGVDVRLGHDRAVVHGCDAVTASSAVPRDEHRGGRGGDHRRRRAAPGRDARLDLRDGPLGGRRRHARQDDDDVDVDADPRRGRLAAELRDRRRCRRCRHRGAVDRRGLVRRRGRRERRHPSGTAAVRNDPHQRRDRPPRPLRDVRPRSWTASTATSPRRRARRCCAPTIRCAPSWRRTTAR